MKISRLDLASSLKAHFAVIAANANVTDADCMNFNTIELSIDRIQHALDLMKERVEVGKRIGRGDNLEPVVVFQPEVVNQVPPIVK